jgi:hypothetical protein
VIAKPEFLMADENDEHGKHFQIADHLKCA